MGTHDKAPAAEGALSGGWSAIARLSDFWVPEFTNKLGGKRRCSFAASSLRYYYAHLLHFCGYSGGGVIVLLGGVS